MEWDYVSIARYFRKHCGLQWNKYQLYHQYFTPGAAFGSLIAVQYHIIVALRKSLLCFNIHWNVYCFIPDNTYEIKQMLNIFWYPLTEELYISTLNVVYMCVYWHCGEELCLHSTKVDQISHIFICAARNKAIISIDHVELILGWVSGFH